jgi:hypothetical protein
MKCPGCGRDKMKAHKGRVPEHVSPGNVRCIWSGQPERVVKFLNNLKRGKR